MNKRGKGQVVYFAGHPETSMYVTKLNSIVITPRDPCGKPRDPEMVTLFCNLIANTGFTTTLDNLPPGVTVETYAHQYKGAEGMQMHLLNLAGILPDGTQEVPDRLFPELTDRLPDPAKPIQITVRGKNIHNAFMLSPDFDGLYEVPLEKKDDAVICRVPAFARYLIIYFNTGDTQALLNLANIPLRTGQPEIKIIETTK